jgi:predicted dinucleotide-binding enzyme
MPPVLFVSNTDSLAEQIQRAFPAARVVKSLNTMNANLMVNPGQLGNGEHSVFVSSNDATAKDAVSGLLRQFGWRDIVDLGDISSARGAEMLMPIWLRLFGETRNPFMNFKLVR